MAGKGTKQIRLGRVEGLLKTIENQKEVYQQTKDAGITVGVPAEVIGMLDAKLAATEIILELVMAHFPELEGDDK